jgi:hypothetical protein
MRGNDDSHLLSRLEEIRDRRERLERRLDDGYARIEQALIDGAEVNAWESFWVELLREYEAVCDELHPAA